MIFVDEHSSRGQNPASVVRDAQVERIAQIVIRSTASFLGVPHAPPAENLARHVGIEFPLFFFLLFVYAWSVELTADIVRWVQVGIVEGVVNFVVPVLGHMKRRLYRAYEFLLQTKVTSWCHSCRSPFLVARAITWTFCSVRRSQRRFLNRVPLLLQAASRSHPTSCQARDRVWGTQRLWPATSALVLSTHPGRAGKRAAIELIANYLLGKKAPWTSFFGAAPHLFQP